MLAALTSLAAPAAAQVPQVELKASPASAEALPGEAALFRVTASNDGPLAVDIEFVAAAPAGWTYNFTPSSLSVPAQGSANATLVVYVPDGASPGSNATLTFHAESESLGRMSADSSVTVFVLAPAPETNAPPEAAPPQLSLSVTTGDAGESGATVTGYLTLLNTDPERASMDVSLSLSGPAAWNPRLEPQDTFRVLHRDVPVTIPLTVDVPALSRNQTASFTLTALVEESTFAATWKVDGIATAASSAGDAGEGNATADATTSGTNESAPSAPSGPALSVLVTPQTIDIAPGETATADVTLTNTGDVPLRLTLSGSSPSEWPPLSFEPRTLELAPGETATAALRLSAPDGLPIGGLGQGTVMVTSDAGLVKTQTFRPHIVAPSAPRQETAPASAPGAVVETPPAGSGLPVGGATLAVAAGLGTVGVGALALANRPLREKLVWAAVGLYTRLARPDVLGHEDREKLYRLVETRPGIHFHALQRDLSWNTGTLTYHIRVLEKHGFLVSRRDGLYRRFYLSGAAPRKETFENKGPSGLRADVLEAVRNQHGISQSDLALLLGANKQTVNYHVKALERGGIIRVEKRGRDTFLYPASDPHQGPGLAQT